MYINNMDRAIGKKDWGFVPDIELKFSEEELEKIDKTLTEEDEEVLREILEITAECDEKKDLFKEVLASMERGVLEYLDSMTDTGEFFSEMKRSDTTKGLDKHEIKPLTPGATQESAVKSQPRTLSDANKAAVRFNNEHITDKMSEQGKVRFKRYSRNYSDRTKSLTQVSTKESPLERSNDKVNNETLAGLRGYRVGPVVAMPTVEQAKQGYKEYKENNPTSLTTEQRWLYDQNMKDFDAQLVRELGFKDISEAKQWRSENSLTVHEDPDGMYMVPNDVHSAARHNGYREKMSKCMTGEITEDELKIQIRQEKMALAKHELKERGTRMAKGVAMSAVKDLLKCLIVVAFSETKQEFSIESEDKLIERFKRILKRCWDHIKNKANQILKILVPNGIGSIVTEIMTAIFDYFGSTLKNIYKVMRQMWRSILQALKIIFCRDSKISFSERVFEAAKILSAGAVAVLGFSLNELILQALTGIGCPAGIADFIADVLSGLFAGVMSSVVLLLFDKFKGEFMTESPYTRKLQLQARRLCISSGRVTISQIKLDMKLVETGKFLAGEFETIFECYKHIEAGLARGAGLQIAITKVVGDSGTRAEKLLQKLENKRKAKR